MNLRSLWFIPGVLVPSTAWHGKAVLLKHIAGGDFARRNMQRSQTAWAKDLLRWSGIDLKVKGRAHMGKGPYIIMPNHRSLFDIPVILGALAKDEYPVGFVMKDSKGQANPKMVNYILSKLLV